MALNTAKVNAAVDAAVADWDFTQLHTADPGSGGTNGVAAEVAGRLATTWPAAASGASAAAPVAFAVTAAGGPYTHVSGWTASTAGTHQGNVALVPNQTFIGPGELTVTITATGAAT